MDIKFGKIKILPNLEEEKTAEKHDKRLSAVFHVMFFNFSVHAF